VLVVVPGAKRALCGARGPLYPPPMHIERAVIDWLLDPRDSDPSIRWQVKRDLLDAAEDEWTAERATIETEGWGAHLLALESEDGSWDGGAHFPAGFRWGDEPGQPWTSTSHSLTQLREFGIMPDSERMQRAITLIGRNVRWEYDDLPYWDGEVEPCINGQAVANGTYFGLDMTPVVERLVGERLEDGGWNCEAERGSVRSSFHTTIDVLESLLEHERAGRGTGAVTTARQGGEEYLLERRLFRRLSTGEPADERMLALIHPSRYIYHVLRGLDYFRSVGMLTGARPDQRLSEAVEHLRSRRLDDGRWPLDWNPTGRTWFDVDDGEGEPSRWITLQALRVLRWWDEAA